MFGFNIARDVTYSLVIDGKDIPLGLINSVETSFKIEALCGPRWTHVLKLTRTGGGLETALTAMTEIAGATFHELIRNAVTVDSYVLSLESLTFGQSSDVGAYNDPNDPITRTLTLCGSKRYRVGDAPFTLLETQ